MTASPLPPAWLHVLFQRSMRPLFVAPCLGCQAPDSDPLCAGCRATLTALPARRCSCCQGSLDETGSCPLCAPGAPYDRVSALGRYAGALREVIRAAKYRARPDLGLWLGSTLSDHLDLATANPLVVPMPVHPRRRRKRGYNQIEPVAWNIARRRGYGYDPRALARITESRPSYQQGRSDRWQAAEQSFRASAAHVSGRDVLLVDDVLTSGATAWSACLALREAGARTIHVAVLARAAMRSSRNWPERSHL